MGKWFEVYAYRLGEAGAYKVAVLFNDITERKHSEEVLTASEEKFRNLTENIPQLVWMAHDNELVYASAQWTEYAGFIPAEVGWIELLHPDDKEILTQAWVKCNQEGRLFSAEARMKNKYGEYRWHVVKASPLKIGLGVATKWIGTFTDIHEQKLSEQKKDEFISIASHEMRTPLTTAKAYLQLLEMTLGKDETTLLYANKASDAIERLNYFITELLDVSKIKNGKLNYTYALFDFDKMVNDTVESVQHSSESHQITKTGIITKAFHGDKHRLQQVVVNLLTNAIKYSPKANEVFIHVEEQDNQLKISVTDTGLGMSKKHLEKVFDKYYRIEEHALQFQGLGIGLYISYEIVERHQGKIWVESKVGKGSTFHLTLPFN